MTKSKINLCDECEFANRSKIAKLESEHSKLKALFAVVRTDLALEKSENAELLEEVRICRECHKRMDERWERLKKRIPTLNSCLDLTILMQELESGGESGPQARRLQCSEAANHKWEQPDEDKGATPKPGRICDEPESSSYEQGCDPGGCDTMCIDKKTRRKA